MITETLNLPTKQQVAPRKIDIDFLFLDLNSCTRCIGTNKNLETAIESVAHVLNFTGVELSLTKILIESVEQARAHHFVISPTIRINGRDIALETKESQCDSCTDLCGCDEGTNCRVWVHRGQEYTEAPVAMIIEALLQEVFNTPQQMIIESNVYAVPENLQHFFAGKAEQVATEALSCCSSVEQQSCCEPSAKASCCGETSGPGSCGCQ